jgi:hypothetical protein
MLSLTTRGAADTAVGWNITLNRQLPPGGSVTDAPPDTQLFVVIANSVEGSKKLPIDSGTFPRLLRITVCAAVAVSSGAVKLNMVFESLGIPCPMVSLTVPLLARKLRSPT